MKMKLGRSLILLLIFSTVACTKKDTKSNSSKGERLAPEKVQKEPTVADKSVDSTFQEFLNYLPELELPVTFDCGSSFINYPDVPKELIVKYAGGENWIFPYRKIPSDLNLIVTLNLAPSDIELPILNTYSLKGELIETKNLFPEFCGADLGFYTQESVTIDNQLNITRYDSTWSYKVDSLENKIEGSEKSEFSISKIAIQSDGKITETLISSVIQKEEKIDTSLLYGIWTQDLDGPHADFWLRKESYYVVDFEGDGHFPYDLDGRILSIHFEDDDIDLEIVRNTRDTLILKTPNSNLETTYFRWDN